MNWFAMIDMQQIRLYNRFTDHVVSKGECFMSSTVQTTQTQASLTLSDVETTGLLTLYCHALESLSPNPILKDDKAVEITQQLTPLLAGSKNRLLRKLAAHEVDQRLVVHIALRARQYDQYAKNFIDRNPEGIIVNLGCGMDSRFYRIDNGRMIFFDLDLPEVIRFKKKVLAESERYRMIAASVFDYRWMDQVAQYGSRPVLFLAEGVFPYLEAGKVKSLVLELQSRFPGSELVCEVVKEIWVKQPLRTLVNIKLQRQVGLGKEAVYRFGISSSREMETWNAGIRFIDDWSYFDTNHEKLGWMGWLGKSKFLRKLQWTVHYRLN